MTEIPVSAVVLTLDEELNLPACLKSLHGLITDVHVVDSGSTDRTCAIAWAGGAQVATHAFAGHGAQWQWAMQHLPLKNQWVLGLDADQRLTPELAAELRALFTDPAGTQDYAAYYVPRRNVFRGRWIRWGGYYPKHLIKLFRRDRLLNEPADLLDHHFRVEGRVGRLRYDIIEENHKENSIDFWIRKHLRYAELLAREEINRRNGARPTTVRGAMFGSPDERAEWQKQTWSWLPRYMRPPAYFVWRYFFRLGFLDGKAGFAFHFLHAFWFRLITDLKIDDLRRGDARTRH